LIINGFEYQLSSLTFIANSCMGIIWAMNGERLCRVLQTAAEKNGSLIGMTQQMC